MTPTPSPLALIILDWRWVEQNTDTCAISLASIPVFDDLKEQYAYTGLITHWADVWLPEWQVGNSEVGHMHLWAGRVLDQDLVQIQKSIDTWELENREIRDQIRKRWKRLHLMGLLSDGGVHSHIDHLIWLLEIVRKKNIQTVLHLYTDGRDTAPKSCMTYIEQILPYIDGENNRIWTIVWRYRSMDRDTRRERTKVAYDTLCTWTWHKISSMIDIDDHIQNQYDQWITDEFLEAHVMDWYIPLEEGDSVLCINYRTDRMRQLVTTLTQENFSDSGMTIKNIHMITMTTYDQWYRWIDVLFPRIQIEKTLWEVIANAWLSQLRIAETEKFPHVTSFFSWWRGELFIWETQERIPSPKVATYNLEPKMSAEQLTSTVIRYMESWRTDFYCINFANPDMVWHTWDLEATQSAVECVDACLWKIVKIAQDLWIDLLILADHGNAEYMKHEDGSPHTAHTLSKVPCIYIPNWSKHLSWVWLSWWWSLKDVAPTILDIIGIEKPKEMTWTSLLIW